MGRRRVAAAVHFRFQILIITSLIGAQFQCVTALNDAVRALNQTVKCEHDYSREKMPKVAPDLDRMYI